MPCGDTWCEPAQLPGMIASDFFSVEIAVVIRVQSIEVTVHGTLVYDLHLWMRMIVLPVGIVELSVVPSTIIIAIVSPEGNVEISPGRHLQRGKGQHAQK